MTPSLKSKVRADGETEFSAFGMLQALMKGRARSNIKRYREKYWEAEGEGWSNKIKIEIGHIQKYLGRFTVVLSG